MLRLRCVHESDTLFYQRAKRSRIITIICLFFGPNFLQVLASGGTSLQQANAAARAGALKGSRAFFMHCLCSISFTFIYPIACAAGPAPDLTAGSHRLAELLASDESDLIEGLGLGDSSRKGSVLLSVPKEIWRLVDVLFKRCDDERMSCLRVMYISFINVSFFAAAWIHVASF